MTESWMICEKTTGRCVFETSNANLLNILNTEKYEAIPALEYLASLNKDKDGGSDDD